MKNQSFRRRLGFAWAGIRHTFQHESSLRTQVLGLSFALISLAIFGASPLWWALFLVISCAVLAAELFNTALEALIDHIHPGQHEAIRIAKDCAAGAVLILSVCSVLVYLAFVWQTVLPRFFAFLPPAS